VVSLSLSLSLSLITHTHTHRAAESAPRRAGLCVALPAASGPAAIALFPSPVKVLGEERGGGGQGDLAGEGEGDQVGEWHVVVPEETDILRTRIATSQEREVLRTRMAASLTGGAHDGGEEEVTQQVSTRIVSPTASSEVCLCPCDCVYLLRAYISTCSWYMSSLVGLQVCVFVCVCVCSRDCYISVSLYACVSLCLCVCGICQTQRPPLLDVSKKTTVRERG
jgi:hypothetical protein